MNELLHWLGTLDPSFAFLLALPFIVAAAGGLAEGVRHLRDRRLRDAENTANKDAPAVRGTRSAGKPSYGL